ncbi:hypothetical protein BE20_09555 [Sorangium cellulosum]|uniref:Uncharacterized protein n=1 Tax=Sorangium cellulosum TaxID=56 RepID=A0A150SLM8_SORCE|nr:hypothetical protein BE18_30455 [Sorangium cellulosum]KYF93342.1 hypothetical protein BE20_09555 [Sorangium cellulosum]
MNPQQAEIYARLEALPLDAEGASFPFTARLAADNGRPAPFARRAVAEYRRFLLLAATADHPVTPSDEVDQASVRPRKVWPGCPDHGEGPRPPGAGEPPPRLHRAHACSPARLRAHVHADVSAATHQPRQPSSGSNGLGNAGQTM